MTERWFFNMDGDDVEMVCRVEGGGMVGDARDRIGPNSKPIIHPKGLTYAALKEAGGGVLEIEDDGSFKIIPSAP